MKQRTNPAESLMKGTEFVGLSWTAILGF